ncbi:hypothetical protein, partial [Agrococcus jejuensis]|uniref:hypothetical protein n=1 Tax=Agrococcus jejuensis TaxID=399736 RepID=UPI001C9305E1
VRREWGGSRGGVMVEGRVVGRERRERMRRRKGRRGRGGRMRMVLGMMGCVLCGWGWVRGGWG